MVHSTTIDEVKKFKILKLKLDDDIAESISYLDENDEESYEKALNKLRKRFERKDLEADHHLDAIYNLQPVAKIEDHKALRKLHSQAMAHVMPLSDPDHRNDLNSRLKQLIIRKLPLQLQTEWNALSRRE